ncbi:MAG: helicase-exonuclease AddAB subunit AddA [Oscillospiraceae bacterium]|jgi:ATP-dependent helicase/nuclease subunit A|nr:helicase-exonuclease AddAB subunit AddA [Oscillospiraceae bacterium]
MKWTEEQAQAIWTRGGTVLVSAAAGSGKTAVLVERVLQRLLDAENPCNIDEMLIVTFTRLAAAEMRERIMTALQAQDDPHIKQQQALLPLAQICTIHVFCLRLIQEHYAQLGLPPKIRLLSESEQKMIQSQAMDDVFEAAYKADSPEFAALGLVMEKGGDDEDFKKAVLRAADSALASPDPTAFLRRSAMPYHDGKSFGKSVWGRSLLAHLRRQTLDFAGYCRDSIEELLQDENIAKCADVFTDDLRQLQFILAALEQDDWDTVGAAFASFAPARLSGKKRKYESAVYERAKVRRALWTSAIKDQKTLFAIDAATHTEDVRNLAPVCDCFIRLVQSYLDRYARLKSEKDRADFSDLEHWALRLLIDENSQKTALAAGIAKQYREILVDEYQDVSEVQGRLFEALSADGGNLFFVGDVKQSIYRFRQANPALFLRKRQTYAPYDGKTFPAAILLGRNFRSRAEVTETVNFAFRQWMTKDAAEMDYTDEDALICGAAYPRGEATGAQLHLLETAGDGLAAEAAHVAAYIKTSIANGDTVFEKGESRRVRSRDFCILLRSEKKHAAAFAQALAEAGLQAHTASSESLFHTREIAFLHALLRLIDSPLQDVPLLSVMLSPVFGFSPADLSNLRAAHPHTRYFYQCLLQEGETDSRCAAFLARLQGYRQAAAMLTLDLLVRHLLEDTAWLSIIGALRNAGKRRANVQLFVDLALQFSENAGASLTGFLRYLEKVERENKLSEVNEISEAADVVRIMTIHKSKGLEFPICILAQCASAFNTEDQKQNLVLHPQMGVGIVLPDLQNRRRLATLPIQAVKRENQAAAKSEELRLLYVAMTRAKERLVMVCTSHNVSGFVQKIAANVSCNRAEMHTYAVQNAKSYADWIIAAFLRHPDAHALRELAGMDASAILPCETGLEVVFVQSEQPDPTQSAEETSALRTADPAVVAEINRRMRYAYPYAALNAIPVKRGASELTEQTQQLRFAFSSKPRFLQGNQLTAAEKGSAMHAFLQYADYASAKSGLNGEIDRLVRDGYISQQEADALEREKLLRFFAGDFAARMLASGDLIREKKFTLRLPAEQFAGGEGNLPALKGEEVVVQGIIDCAFAEGDGYVLLDYKTDRVSSMDLLVERYKEQIKLYATAMRKCFGLRVSELLIYSFWHEKWITVE